MNSAFLRHVASIVLVAFTLTTVVPRGYGAELILPQADKLLSSGAAFTPVVIKGMVIHPEDPLKFDFIMDTGTRQPAGDELKAEAERSVKYFLASLTVPEGQMWVNLSPLEKDRIIPEAFGQTVMGRDLLGEDYVLKQMASSMTFPESALGKEFWAKVYAKAAKAGVTDINTDAINRVWIVPAEAKVWENNGKVFIMHSRLKVMLEADYLALAKEQEAQTSSATTQIMRDILIPAIEKEVNEGEHFARLRQIYAAMILSAWYKIRLKETLLGAVYTNKNKVAGVEFNGGPDKNKIYDQYLEAVKKGVYNFVREEQDPATGDILPRKYFSGGVDASELVKTVEAGIVSGPQEAAPVALLAKELDHAMNVAVQLQRPADQAKKTVSLSLADRVNNWTARAARALKEGTILAFSSVAPASVPFATELKVVGQISENPSDTADRAMTDNTRFLEDVAATVKDVLGQEDAGFLEAVRVIWDDPLVKSLDRKGQVETSVAVDRKYGNIVVRITIADPLNKAGDITNWVTINNGLQDNKFYHWDGYEGYSDADTTVALKQNLETMMGGEKGGERKMLMAWDALSADRAMMVKLRNGGEYPKYDVDMYQAFLGAMYDNAVAQFRQIWDLARGRESQLGRSHETFQMDASVLFTLDADGRKTLKPIVRDVLRSSMSNYDAEGPDFPMMYEHAYDGQTFADMEAATRQLPDWKPDAEADRAMTADLMNMMDEEQFGLVADELRRLWRTDRKAFQTVVESVVAHQHYAELSQILMTTHEQAVINLQGPQITELDNLRSFIGKIREAYLGKTKVELNGLEMPVDHWVFALNTIWGKVSQAKGNLSLELISDSGGMYGGIAPVQDVARLLARDLGGLKIVGFRHEAWDPEFGWDTYGINMKPKGRLWVKSLFSRKVSEEKMASIRKWLVQTGEKLAAKNIIFTGRLDSLMPADQGKDNSQVGGIDLDARKLGLEIKRDEKGFPLPASKQDWKQIDIPGFTPVIYRIEPVNIPQLLGMNTEGQPAAVSGEQAKAPIKDLPAARELEPAEV